MAAKSDNIIPCAASQQEQDQNWARVVFLGVCLCWVWSSEGGTTIY